jgi:hypothetical protein
MYAVHIMFRREFAALPGLIGGVAAGDRARTRVIADHVALITDLLHVHHRSEDAHCWPKLVTRGPQDVAPIVELMESQHKGVDTALQAVEQKTAMWRESAIATDRDALADAVEEILQPLGEHLDTEEKNILPLIDRYLTAEEWADVGNKGLVNVPRSKVPVLFGMMLRDASDVHLKLFKEAIPTPVFAVMSRVGPIAYKRYQRKLLASV